METEKQHLVGKNLPELTEFVTVFDEPAFRAKQLFKGIYQRRLVDFDSFTDVSKKLRRSLVEIAKLQSLHLETRFVSTDGTRRYLFKTEDGNPVEAVFIPSEKRDTICFSSQSGCALNCDFCLTAKLGFLKNLSAGEIIEQVIFVLNDVYGVGGETPHGTNLVAMGAGEPFYNFENLIKAIRVMGDEDGLFIVPSRITVSTVGIVPKIREFTELENRPRLAISLSAPNDEIRDRLMPVNKRWNLSELMTAAAEFENSLKRGERFTFEYVLLAGVNDGYNHALELVELIDKHDLKKVKINLIPHNSAEPLEYRAPSAAKVAEFKSVLELNGISAYVRRARGDDIFAACGQLSAKETAKSVSD